MQVTSFQPIIYKNRTKENQILVPKDWQQKAWDFAGNSNSFTYYKEQRNAPEDRRQQGQNFMGKIGEYAASKWMEQHFGSSFEVDLNIYESHDKSWEADLPYTKNNLPIDLHVKACAKIIQGAESDFPISWMFQYRNANNNNGLDDLFVNGTDKDFICFAYVNRDEPSIDNGAYIMAFLPWTIVRPLLQNPILARHKGKKKCLYLEEALEIYGDSEYAI